MVHCIHNNQNKKKENYLNIDINEDLKQEMMLLSTKEEDKSLKQSTNQLTNQQDTNKELKSDAFSVLSYDQVKRLHNVMEQVVPINGKGNFPTLDIKLKDLVKVVRTKLETEQNIKINDIRLNGGAASYILLPDNSTYNDLDLIFAVDLSDHKTYEAIRTAVLDSLLDFLPEGTNKKRISQMSLKDAYIHKMVKVSEKDEWSLISLSNNRGRNVELKFVHRMKRQYEFSIDSFHIILDSLMLFYECSDRPISENIYPTVLAESVYGNFNEAFSHLEKKLIVTEKPEEIRGGGLLKYCNLLIRNYKPIQPDETKNLERYMCSRFFIDFSELPQQRSKLESYLANHFTGDNLTKTYYLMQLYKVVNESTVCLMNHERRQTLGLIEEMAYHFYLRCSQQQQQQPNQHTPHHYSIHFPHYSNTKPNQTPQFIPHVHHLIRPHAHQYETVVVAKQHQQQSKQQNNSTTNTSNNSNNSTNTVNNSSSNAQQSNHHSNSNHNNNNLTNCKNSSTKNQQHIQQQQQYHAYLFGNNPNTFYHYNPYHHYHHNHNQCNCQFNNYGWMACA